MISLLTAMKKYSLAAILSLFLFTVSFAQQSFVLKEKVEVEWKGKWYKGTILEANGKNYKIHYDGYASSWDEVVAATRIRKLNETTKLPAKEKAEAVVKYGKYGCTASRYNNGSYEYLPKGSFVLSKNGGYTYNGFSKPSSGSYTISTTGIIQFKGGYFDKGEATPIEGYANRYYLVFPTIPDNRWTCSLQKEE